MFVVVGVVGVNVVVYVYVVEVVYVVVEVDVVVYYNMGKVVIGSSACSGSSAYSRVSIRCVTRVRYDLATVIKPDVSLPDPGITMLGLMMPEPGLMMLGLMMPDRPPRLVNISV